MKIISKSHDYYDSVTAYGVDTSRVYVRTEEVIHDDKLIKDIHDKILSNMNLGSKYPTFPRYDGRNYPHGILRNIIIGFCGKLYPIMHSENYGAASTNILNMEHLSILNAKYNLFERESFFGGFTKEKCEKYLTPVEYIKPFEELRCPIFIIDYDPKSILRKLVIFKNATLKKFDFGKVKDPFTAFMEIQSFISDILCLPRINEPIKISDKDMLQKKGFDLKTSFRKEKS